MSVELKPCPFCGSPASMESQFGIEWWAQCTNIQCNAADGAIHHDAQAALTWWNRRPASGMQGMEAPSDQPHELIDALLNVALYGDRGNERGMRWQIGELLNSRAAIAAATSPNEGGKG